ncbi:hypothetical protein EMIHUDRAFT_234010 [Emiliania huxleyi CCMP1516]|uniref:Uncharacterized protein n=2 Tax=Emiliania huxleyi TaxID=2903 RepID=A0A0D3K150_EMIH1|nr:hypothetical protein EMIHUDRAFT_234010 [Emiliania huxleyi CCMP1516]EOD29485.1 hypothetical protein EMIHUDRAFT_234010 [Emiliania huxleyi CCMP1516]|eukprot:XP_005781914.1 hypothetical protein EMIHUDRAFT_234010 [Emiliania huxleyi CCMP1516]
MRLEVVPFPTSLPPSPPEPPAPRYGTVVGFLARGPGMEPPVLSLSLVFGAVGAAGAALSAHQSEMASIFPVFFGAVCLSLAAFSVSNALLCGDELARAWAFVIPLHPLPLTALLLLVPADDLLRAKESVDIFRLPGTVLVGAIGAVTATMPRPLRWKCMVVAGFLLSIASAFGVATYLLDERLSFICNEMFPYHLSALGSLALTHCVRPPGVPSSIALWALAVLFLFAVFGPEWVRPMLIAGPVLLAHVVVSFQREECETNLKGAAADEEAAAPVACRTAHSSGGVTVTQLLVAALAALQLVDQNMAVKSEVRMDASRLLHATDQRVLTAEPGTGDVTGWHSTALRVRSLPGFDLIREVPLEGLEGGHCDTLRAGTVVDGRLICTVDTPVFDGPPGERFFLRVYDAGSLAFQRAIPLDFAPAFGALAVKVGYQCPGVVVGCPTLLAFEDY